MHARIALGLAVLLGTVLLLAETYAAGFRGTSAKVHWQSDLRVAHRLATADDRPMLIVFGADWCGYCKKLEQKTLGRKELAEYVNTKFVPVHVDFDKEPRIAEILEVRTLPCTIVLSPKADLIGRLDGYVEHEQYTELLEGALAMQQRIRIAEEAGFGARR